MPQPSSGRARGIGMRSGQKIDKRRSACKAIESARVGVGPVDRAIGRDQFSRRKADRVVVVEGAGHPYWRNDRLPNSHLGREGMDGTRIDFRSEDSVG